MPLWQETILFHLMIYTLSQKTQLQIDWLTVHPLVKPVTHLTSTNFNIEDAPIINRLHPHCHYS
ncbi:hypothetical protein MANES_14G151967v8 [Manihot esculenta]|uniref:Uncharacterized protein n=1 Tax=Manihot esculenta TaxID=3983 RepID=A0ACB7GGS3_MANES|nr:hypothetical protein MANES_14G151967v8 [Manihot esculenta]